MGLPDYIETGGNEIPLVIQDKIFVGQRTSSPTTRPGRAPTTPGSLWYAHTYDPNRVGPRDPQGSPAPGSIGHPRVLRRHHAGQRHGLPEATVQARRYRLRILNACNARFLNLQLYVDDGSPNGITLDRQRHPDEYAVRERRHGKPTWLQIGTEGGFLLEASEDSVQRAARVPLPPDPDTGQTDPSKVLKSLLVAPAERPDLIVDFSGVCQGQNMILYNEPPPLSRRGRPVTTTSRAGTQQRQPGQRTTHPGFGPNTRVLMRFNVVPATDAPGPHRCISTRFTNLTRRTSIRSCCRRAIHQYRLRSSSVS